MIWIFIGGASLVAAVFLVVGTLRSGRNVLRRSDGAIAIFTDQLKEVDRDKDRGLISKEEARAAQFEIKRRLLREVKQVKDDKPANTEIRGGWAIYLSAVLVPVVAAVVYLQVGSPDTPSLAFADRMEEQVQAREIADLTQQLKTRLSEDENGGPTEGWLLLGQTYMRLDRYDDAADSFSRVQDRPDVTTEMILQYGEALVAAENGVITPKAAGVFDRAIGMEPQNPAAIYYKALSVGQLGSPELAYSMLFDRLNAADGYESWMEVYVEQINRIGVQLEKEPISMADYAPIARGPTAEQVQAAAEMTEEERRDFVRSMVARLADRLNDQPDDLDGWLQLAQAYRVLGEIGKANSAYQSAERLTKLLPEGDPRKAVVASGLAETQS